jgi:OPA family sugar phosphate sensor protein UhpC-like MFS transporter
MEHGHSIGEGLTFVGTAALVSALGWKAGFIGRGLFCIAVAVGRYVTLQDRPSTMGLPTVMDYRNDHNASLIKEHGMTMSTKRAQFQILRISVMWILGLACATMSDAHYAINRRGILCLQ